MRSKFVYKPRSAESIQRRATQSGGDYDTFFDSRFQKFTAAGGQNYVRILPPTWDEPEHFGFEYYLHSNVGPDNAQYLCLERNADLAERHGVEAGRCPVCEERRSLEREGETEEANKLRAVRRIGAWVIDRNEEKDGPKFWDMSWTMDKDIATLCINKRTGEALLIDHPDEGYDFEFVREGKGLNTRYIGKQVSRQTSPISDDERQQDTWLEFTQNNPIPDVFNFYDYAYIAKVFAGRKTVEEKTEEPPPPRRVREVSRREEPEEDKPPFDDAKEVKRPRAQAKDDEEEEEDVPMPTSFRERMAKVNERNVRR